MGKLSHDPVIHHFSHNHPLELSSSQQIHITSSCSGCALGLSGWIYTCKPCNYSLHISCSQAPQLIHHPADPNHSLPLLPHPAYPQGYFNCDACGRRGTGFSYHCGTCDLDLHVLCASMPLSLFHQAHHHPLHLAFCPPYQNKGFSCDICHNLGSNHWLYRCALCEFDAHLGCAGSSMKASSVQGKQQQHQIIQRAASAQQAPSVQVQQQHQMLQTASSTTPLCGVGATPQFQAPRAMYSNGIQQNYAPNNHVYRPSSGVPPASAPVGSGQGNGLFGFAIQGLVDAATQQIGQGLVQSLLGGGGGGGGRDGGVDASGGDGGGGADAGGGDGGSSWGAGDGSGDWKPYI